MNCADCKYSHDTGAGLVCWGQRFAPPVDHDHWCEGWKPKSIMPWTNYDRIIRMTPEELAIYLCELANGDCPILGDCPEEMQDKYTCTPSECWLSWLKSPVEVDE